MLCSDIISDSISMVGGTPNIIITVAHGQCFIHKPIQFSVYAMDMNHTGAFCVLLHF